MISPRTRNRLGAALLASSLLAACSSSTPASQEPLEPAAVQQVASTWTDAFSVAIPNGPAAIAPVAAAYLAQVSPVQADQIAELLGDKGYTYGGMRETLAGADNELGQFDDALAQLDRIAADSPDTMPASSLAFARALDMVGIDSRSGVLVEDPAKLHALIAALAANQPATADRWSEMYGYQLGVALYLDGQLEPALRQLMPIVDANVERSNGPGRLDAMTLGSALNLTVSALKSRGDLVTAQGYLDRAIALDDTYHLNFAGRFGADTNPATLR